MKLLTKSDRHDAQLGVVERVAYMSGNAGISFVNTIIAAFMLFYYTDVIHLNAATIGTIILVSRIFDGFSDIFFGFMIDYTKSRVGKSRVWILRSILPYLASTILLFSVPISVNPLIQYIYVFITYNLCNAICLTALSVAYNSMLVNITANSYEHGLLGVLAMIGASIGSVGVQSFFINLVEQLGGTPKAWQLAGIIFAVFGSFLAFICFLFTKERVKESEKPKVSRAVLKSDFLDLVKNKYWVLAVLICFFITLINGVVGSLMMYYVKTLFIDTKFYAPLANVFALSSLLALFLSVIFLKLFGKRNTMIIGLVITASAGVFQGIFSGRPADFQFILIMCGIRGFGGGLAMSGIYGVAADAVEYGEWKTGKNYSGVGLAGITFGTKVATGLSVALAGVLINFSGYSGALRVQPMAVLAKVNLYINYLPVVLCIMLGICLAVYDLEKIYPKIQADLAEKRKNEIQGEEAIEA